MCLFIETLRIEDGKVWHASLHDRRMNDTRRAFFGPVMELVIHPGNINIPKNKQFLQKMQKKY